MATIVFNAGIDTTRVSPYSRSVLSRVLDAAGCPGATISSVCRTPHDLARIMHDNCIGKGAAAEMAIYMPPGKAVIQIFIDDIHKSAVDTIADMEAEIIRQGPANVSHHCCDPNIKEVFDLTDSSLGDFRAKVKASALVDSGISKVLDENGVIHLEIDQPQVPTAA
jgi:hypothetical protein